DKISDIIMAQAEPGSSESEKGNKLDGGQTRCGPDGTGDYLQVYLMTAAADVEFAPEVMLRDTLTACWLAKLAIMSGFVQVNNTPLIIHATLFESVLIK